MGRDAKIQISVRDLIIKTAAKLQLPIHDVALVIDTFKELAFDIAKKRDSNIAIVEEVKEAK